MNLLGFLHTEKPKKKFFDQPNNQKPKPKKLNKSHFQGFVLKTPKMDFLPVFELMSDSLTATKVETNQCPSHQSILLTQGPIHEIFMKKYWELTKPWKWLLFSFLVFGFWLLGCSKKFFFGFSVWKKPRRFIWGSIYSCTMDGFFRIFKKAVSELICTRLYNLISIINYLGC